MADKKLVEWIKDAEEKGHSRDKIKNILKKHGHKKEHIEKAMKHSKPSEKEKIRNIVKNQKKGFFERLIYFFHVNKRIFATGLFILIIILGLFLVITNIEPEEDKIKKPHSPDQVSDEKAAQEAIGEDEEIDYQEVNTSEGETKKELEDRGVIQDEFKQEENKIIEEIVIQNFIGTPANMEIRKGTTVRFINEHEKQKHIIGIREWDGKRYIKAPIDGWVTLYTGDHYDYEFRIPGDYLWLSREYTTRTSGQIKVLD